MVRSASRDLDRAAKEFRPTPDQTTVYVFRDGTQFETGVGDQERMSVQLDGALLGVTVARTFLLAVVAPGPHELVSTAGGNQARLAFDGQPGEIVYVQQQASYVVSVRTKLVRMEAADAQPRIRGCGLAVGAAPPRPPAAPPPVAPAPAALAPSPEAPVPPPAAPAPAAPPR